MHEDDIMDDPILHEFLLHDDFGPLISLVKLLEQELIEPLDSNLEIGRRKRPNRKRGWVEQKILTCSDSAFKRHFRMKRSAFDELLRLVSNSMSFDDDTDLRRKLLYTLWLLSKSDSFSAVGNLFNLPKSSGRTILKEVVHSLRSLLPSFVRWPDRDSYSKIADRFFDASNGIPGVIGITGTCHISCKQPSNSKVDYNDTSVFCSIILQGTCDPDGKFIDVFIGMPSRTEETGMFQQSSLFGKLMNREAPLLPPEYHIVGEADYPLHENVLIPFPNDGDLTGQEIRYNTKLRKLQRIAERSFDRFKRTFERLQFLITADMEFANEIIAACCVLHNFIIEREVEQGETKGKEKLEHSSDSFGIDDANCQREKRRQR